MTRPLVFGTSNVRGMGTWTLNTRRTVHIFRVATPIERRNPQSY